MPGRDHLTTPVDGQSPEARAAALRDERRGAVGRDGDVDGSGHRVELHLPTRDKVLPAIEKTVTVPSPVLATSARVPAWLIDTPLAPAKRHANAFEAFLQ